jgi:trans-aconitate 2-methyltransferase
MTDTWNPAQYDKFQAEREQPFFDLLKMVRPRAAMHVVDLGCGTGRLTRLLHERLAGGRTIGIDRSARMLESGLAEALPAGLALEVATIEAFPGERGTFDLIFSNAAFHWVDDHPALVARLAAALRPGGQLAFQVPAQHDEPSHRIAEEIAEVEPFRSGFAGWHRRQPVLPPEEYARLLHRLAFPEQEVRLMVYPHVLPGRDDVVEWMKGTLLTEYARHLRPELFDRFVEEYRKRLIGQLEPARPFFFPFKRILCWGQRA